MAQYRNVTEFLTKIRETYNKEFVFYCLTIPLYINTQPPHPPNILICGTKKHSLMIGNVLYLDLI